MLVGASKTAALLLAVVHPAEAHTPKLERHANLTKTASARGSPHAAETVPSAWHGSQPDASPVPIRTPSHKTPQTHML